MYHQTSVGFMVRGDTGVTLAAITTRLTALGEGKSVAWRRMSCVGGGEITVTRRGEMFAVSGQSRA